jgi:ATP-dependent DNA helicase RecG
LLDYPAYFDLAKKPLPDKRDGILNGLAAAGLIQTCQAGGWNITNLGAVLFARRLSDFRSVRRKAIRVILYEGPSRVKTIREIDGSKGYAAGFDGLIGYINGMLPSNEIIGKALRREVPVYPELAVRELVAKALIHQDFFISGASPMVELFSDRMEVSNPGVPLIETDRFLDTPPKFYKKESQQETLRPRLNFC